MKVQDLLTDENKWTLKELARDEFGKTVHVASRKAVRWCIVGAIQRTYGLDDSLPILERVFNEFAKPAGFICNGEWNDAPERTFADVRKVIEELDI